VIADDAAFDMGWRLFELDALSSTHLAQGAAYSQCCDRIAGGHMKDVVVIGAGKIGATVARLLASTDDYRVTLADRSAEVFDRLDRDNRIRTTVADVENSS
jgi:glutamyl-tRNA reductase